MNIPLDIRTEYNSVPSNAKSEAQRLFVKEVSICCLLFYCPSKLSRSLVYVFARANFARFHSWFGSATKLSGLLAVRITPPRLTSFTFLSLKQLKKQLIKHSFYLKLLLKGIIAYKSLFTSYIILHAFCLNGRVTGLHYKSISLQYVDLKSLISLITSFTNTIQRLLNTKSIVSRFNEFLLAVNSYLFDLLLLPKHD